MKNKMKKKWVLAVVVAVVLLVSGLGLSSFFVWSKAPHLQEGEIPTLEVTCNGEKLDAFFDYCSVYGCWEYFLGPLPSVHIVKAGSVLEFTFSVAPKAKKFIVNRAFAPRI